VESGDAQAARAAATATAEAPDDLPEPLLVGQVHLLEGVALGAPIEETLETLAGLMDASLAGQAHVALYRLDDEADPPQLVLVAAPGLPAEYIRVARAGVPLESGTGGCVEAARRCEPYLVPDLAAEGEVGEGAENPYLDPLRAAGLRASWSVPVLSAEAARGTARGLLGTLALWYREPRAPGEPLPHGHEAVVRVGTHLARIALEREDSARTLARLYEKEKRIAETLQRSLLTLPAVEFPGLEYAYVYESARDEAQIGGDFYDVFALPDNRVALVVGDLTGKGLEAAAATAEVKFTLRAFLREYPDPAAALWRLNRSLLEAQRLSGRARDNLVAVVVAVLDMETGVLHLSGGGAEPPLLLVQAGHDAGSAGGYVGQAIPGGRGPLLGTMPEDAYPLAVYSLAPGDALVLFTDGLTESRRPGPNPDDSPQDPRVFGWDAVAEQAARLCAGSGADMKVLTHGLVEAATEYGGGHLSDDVCVLAARWMPAETIRRAREESLPVDVPLGMSAL
jgi:Serine phosphatase RsbU, regulator of sigma subunit